MWRGGIHGQQADAQQGLKLIQALGSTLEFHPLLGVQEQNIEFSEGVRRDAGGVFDTLLTGSASYGRSHRPLTSIQQPDQAVAGLDIDNNVTGFASLNGSLTKQSRNGITVGPVVNLNRTRDDLLRVLGVHRSSVRFQVNLPLLRNRDRDEAASWAFEALRHRHPPTEPAVRPTGPLPRAANVERCAKRFTFWESSTTPIWSG